jgi:hypothetical protein
MSEFGTLTGTLFEDSNNNGVWDLGEPGLDAGLTVTVTEDGDSNGNGISNETYTATTNASGYYEITGILPGTYEISTPGPGGDWLQTLPTSPPGTYTETFEARGSVMIDFEDAETIIGGPADNQDLPTGAYSAEGFEFSLVTMDAGGNIIPVAQRPVLESAGDADTDPDGFRSRSEADVLAGNPGSWDKDYDSTPGHDLDSYLLRTTGVTTGGTTPVETAALLIEYGFEGGALDAMGQIWDIDGEDVNGNERWLVQGFDADGNLVDFEVSPWGNNLNRQTDTPSGYESRGWEFNLSAGPGEKPIDHILISFMGKGVDYNNNGIEDWLDLDIDGDGVNDIAAETDYDPNLMQDVSGANPFPKMTGLGLAFDNFKATVVDSKERNFGFFLPPPPSPVTLGDYVWHDANGNGIQDGGELGIDNVTVRLLDENLNQINQAFTGLGGFYSFNVTAGETYYVQFDLPTGYEFTLKQENDPLARGVDSDADRLTGKTGAIAVPDPVTDPDSLLRVDAGLTNFNQGGEGGTIGWWKNNGLRRGAWTPTGLMTSDLFENVFGVDLDGSGTIGDGPTFLEALNQRGNRTGLENLQRQATAAILNALSPTVSFGITSAQVIQTVQDAFDIGTKPAYVEAASYLDGLNNAGGDLT